jgi:hypothetical protein
MFAVTAACYGGLELDANSGAGAGNSDTAADSGDSGDSGDTGPDGGAPQGLCGDPSVGATDLRRLTGAQFDNTVRDLLGVEGNYSADFTPDERVGPFTSNVSAPVSELQVELYMAASESIAEEAVASMTTLLPCDPAAMGDDACAEEFFADFVPRAYRRPLEAGELDKVMSVYNAGKAEGDFANGVRVAIAAVLQSPYFLYHVEFGNEGQTAPDGVTVALTDYEMASRLSYFLWNTMPDDDLFAAAEAGDLTDATALAALVDEMIADPRTEEAISSFHTQWLGVDQMALIEKDPGLFPDYDSDLAVTMQQDVEEFAKHVIIEGDAKIQTLLTANYTVSDDPELLALYGVTLPAGHQSGDPIALPATERAGLLTTPAVLTRQAHADQTSPIYRGILVRQNFFCQPLPPPPADVDNVAPDPDPNATTRERFSEHTANPECAGCHSLIDPIGFGLENYDAVGAFRTEEGTLPIDASGELNATDIDGTFDGGVELANLLADSQQVHECVAKQWFRFAVGRGETSEDQCSLDHLYESLADSDNDVRVLLREIVMSDGFRFRRAPEDA